MVRYIADDEEDARTIQEAAAVAYLVLLVGGRPSQTFPLRGEVKLGRERANAVVVADHKVSRYHASLTPIDNTFIISDQGSANGTYLNGVLIAQPTRLKDNDRISIGDTTFLFTTRPPDLNAIDLASSAPAPLSLVQPVAMPRSQLSYGVAPLSSEQSFPLWALMGCMALVIVTLLFILALLLGLFVGRSQVIGLLLLVFSVF